MLLKSQEIVLKNKDFFKERVILLYGENQDLINDLNQQIVSKFIEEKKKDTEYHNYKDTKIILIAPPKIKEDFGSR